MLSFKLYVLAFMAWALQTQLATAAVSYPARVLDTNVSNQACPLEEQRRVTQMSAVPVLMVALMDQIFQHLLGRTISARQV